ncbi:MAG: hypothetical protein IKS59_03975 [Aeriscardovia sp.]|nr:hypothetical protein [Aeriscardovia sp.]
MKVNLKSLRLYSAILAGIHVVITILSFFAHKTKVTKRTCRMTVFFSILTAIFTLVDSKEKQDNDKTEEEEISNIQ